MESTCGAPFQSTDKVQEHTFQVATLVAADGIHFHNQWAQDFCLLELEILPFSQTSLMACQQVQEKRLLADEDQSIDLLEEVSRRASSSEDSYFTPTECNMDLDLGFANAPPQQSMDVPESKGRCLSIKPNFVGLWKRLCKGLSPSKERCVSCLSSKFTERLETLPCQHKYCDSCISRMALIAVTDEQLFPPKCCSQEIPLKLITSKLRRKEKILYWYKMQEYATPNKDRRYCPALGCGRWIPNDKLKNQSSTYNCPHCDTAICSHCHNTAHASSQCPLDPGLDAFIRLARIEKWQKCYNCGAMVEIESGCHHVTCRCGAQFCYDCGKPWLITCSCGDSGNRGTGRLEPEVGGNGLTADEVTELEAMVTAVAYAERELEKEASEKERRGHQQTG